MSYRPSATGPSDVPEAVRRQLAAADELLATTDLVGSTPEEARRVVEAAGLPFRYVDLDAPPPHVLTADLRPGRITAMVRGGVVVKAESTG